MWKINFHGKFTKEKFDVTISTPEDVYEYINKIGTKKNLEFDKVVQID